MSDDLESGAEIDSLCEQLIDFIADRPVALEDGAAEPLAMLFAAAGKAVPAAAPRMPSKSSERERDILEILSWGFKRSAAGDVSYRAFEFEVSGTDSSFDRMIEVSRIWRGRARAASPWRGSR